MGEGSMDNRYESSTNHSYQADLAVSLVATLGRDGAIKACQENCWQGVLDHVLTPKKNGSGS